MKFNVKVTRRSGILAEMVARARNLPPAFKRGAILLLTDAQGKIRSKNDGTWKPTLESTFGTALFRNGALFRSLTYGAAENLFADIPGGVRVGSNLRTPDGRFNIGRLMQEGTGIYGPRGRKIEAKPGRRLAFRVNGGMIFARSVKGSPARPFMYIDEENAQRVGAIFLRYVTQGELT